MRPRKTLVAALAAVAVTALVWTVSRTETGLPFELKSLDYRFQTRPAEEIAPNLLVVAIDDASLNVAGRWPWPRDYHAALLDAMVANKPAAVAFDVLFIEPDTTSTNADALLAASASRLGHVVFGAASKGNGDGAAQLPLPILSSASSTGFINAERDSDGVLRRIPMWVNTGGKREPSLVLQTLCVGLGLTVQATSIERAGSDIELVSDAPNGRGLAIPVDQNGNLLINYRHAGADFTRSSLAVNYLSILKSYAQIAEGKLPDWSLSQLRGKVILVGLTATGFDVAPTPVDPNMPLVLAQANAIHNILQQDFLRQPSPWLFWPLAILGLFGLALHNVYHSPLRSSIFSLLLLVAYSAATWMAFRYWSVWLEWFWPVAGMVLVVITVTTYQFFTEEREKRFVKQAFQHYLSPNVMTEVLNNPHKLVLGGVRRKMTVLFSDIRGFTLYSEKRPPEEVVPVLNELQDELSKVIFRHDGTLNKFMGDAIMAFWGAPTEPKPDDSLRAVRAAIEMVETLQRLETKWRAQGIEPFGIGIGINTGEMIVGNMGSTTHFDYTVIGDEVNLGARLESLTRQFDANIIVSEATYREVKEHVQSKDLGETTVKGRAKPVRIYALNGMCKPS
ncbi:MAG: adenylate/guanylate cyclase domain-containing protein [Verrucomicrobiae bacterium]|nr:adenylate/guanylate cyclase domain-containing protein [Verrucomicrobiae bacterium]